ncbi:unnamed protein product [Spirodela intermedia]|uniref:Uncharacterized protein n=1 Tax=Spirodela intermedia TaxID=51605 RepID=A0A7I8J464_SPIIN|nr:unnamed protein product [Spirodela intermedia]CAA6664834.1 unnamed protein product [Spirodela intermedia]
MTTLSEKRSANAVGGKTARACDSCLRRRARWYCAADDAFLCQSCDTLVHSANPLARRHERVRLKTASSSSPLPPFKQAALPTAPSWHQGFKRKARTPRARHTAMAPAAAKSEPLVPDFEATSLDETAEEEGEEEEEEQLLYRVPIFDPVLAEFCSSHVSDDSAATSSGEAKPAMNPSPKYASSPGGFVNALPGFSPSDSLLGRVLDEDAFSMEGLGLMEAGGDGADCCFGGGGYVKLETSDGDDPNGETLDLNFECGSPAPTPAKLAVPPAMGASVKRRITLRLDYEGVIDAWSSTQGCSSPWTNGARPQINPDECLPDFMMSGGGDGGPGGGSMGGAQGAAGDGGREARVSRYREKRRTRLFSKKIRYEVRKLNAEKRPRMKGRFVKSASFGGAAGAPAGVAPQPAFAF